MKKYWVVLALWITAIMHVNAQQKKKTHHMMISIHSGQNAYHPQIVITKEDGTQEIIMADKKSWLWTARTFGTKNAGIAANEDSLFLTLKPYFDNGWRLQATSVMSNGMNSGSVLADDYITRYFLTKDDE